MSLDFHPKKNDLFCFCDSKNEIRYWNTTPFSCTRVSKVGLLTFVFSLINPHPLSSVFLMYKFDLILLIEWQQGGSAQVRFQPISGQLLAAASDEVVSIYDVENDRQTHTFQVCAILLTS